MYVLIVEEDEQRRNELIGGLEAGGYTVLAVADVNQAEALAHQHPIAVAICNVDLVVGVGSFLAAALRRRNATVLYLCPELVAPSGLRTFWLNRGAETDSVVRIVQWLQPPRPKSDDSNM